MRISGVFFCSNNEGYQYIYRGKDRQKPAKSTFKLTRRGQNSVREQV